MLLGIQVAYVQCTASLVVLEIALSDSLCLPSTEHSSTQCNFINALRSKRLARKRLGQLEIRKLTQLSLIECAAAVYDAQYTSC